MLVIAKLVAAMYLFTYDSMSVDLESTLQCHKRFYNHTVTKKDVNGRACWDVIPVLSCWGRCDSHEISDWKFPYKRSFHPVCLHAAREPVKVILKNCDEDAEPGTELFEYLQAVTCKCSTCKSTEASCEAIRFKESRFYPDLIVN